MAKKKIDRLTEIKNQMFLKSPTLGEQYPNVKSISLSVTYLDPDDGKTIKETRNWNLDSKAYFVIDCPYRECVGGGFDISKLVVDAINQGEAESTGELTCQGWQDKERVNKHSCLLKGKFKISIQYI